MKKLLVGLTLMVSLPSLAGLFEDPFHVENLRGQLEIQHKFSGEVSNVKISGNWKDYVARGSIIKTLTYSLDSKVNECQLTIPTKSDILEVSDCSFRIRSQDVIKLRKEEVLRGANTISILGAELTQENRNDAEDVISELKSMIREKYQSYYNSNTKFTTSFHPYQPYSDDYKLTPKATPSRVLFTTLNFSPNNSQDLFVVDAKYLSAQDIIDYVADLGGGAEFCKDLDRAIAEAMAAGKIAAFDISFITKGKMLDSFTESNKGHCKNSLNSYLSTDKPGKWFHVSQGINTSSQIRGTTGDVRKDVFIVIYKSHTGAVEQKVVFAKTINGNALR